MKKIVFLSIFAAFFATVAFAFGLYSSVKQNFAFKGILSIYLAVFPATEHRPTFVDSPAITDSKVLDFDPASIVRIASAADVAVRREALIAVAFGEDGLPSEVRDLEGRRDLNGYMADEFAEISEVFAVVSTMPLGFQSHYWRLIPHEPRSCLMVFHQGHANRIFDNGGREAIRRFLAEGCTVIALQMPHQHENQTLHYIDDPDLGPIKIVDHQFFPILQEADGTLVDVAGTPLRFFLEPIALALNYELDRQSFETVGMVGISGGGWTTTVYAAMDPRIAASYPVAGTLPTYLRAGAHSFGDWEQSFGPMLRAANYLEMYVMASKEAGRRQVQVLNRFDPCCFHGTYHLLYEKAISNMTPNFTVFLDESHRDHIISGAALDYIVSDFLHYSAPSARMSSFSVARQSRPAERTGSQ